MLNTLFVLVTVAFEDGIGRMAGPLVEKADAPANRVGEPASP